ncbi:DUF736 domain-containing protein [Caulobacter hibisci]|uniref:DUF736 domain-containing protein n=1 Tax=Caulobacter hibisci TaxID=2035993 RepID=A0ABS0T261_9CAUL|nr:DUF736 domain-containing protein [Caulobacter hibisci]MBI1685185.1 DUF736 domain-containing protein [Caulobacter hibisci]
MTTIGTFRRDGDDFVGRVSTLMIDATVRLTATPKVSPSAPVFRAFTGEAECGAAWRPTDAASGAVLNVKLDDPTWAEPIHARLMAGEETYPLVWIRRQEERPKEERPKDTAAPEPKPRAAPS